MNSTLTPVEKAKAELIEAQRRFARMQKMMGDGTINVPDVTQSPAYLRLKDAERAAAFFEQGAGMDETADITTTLTDGVEILNAEGLPLGQHIADAIKAVSAVQHGGAVA